MNFNLTSTYYMKMDKYKTVEIDSRIGDWRRYNNNVGKLDLRSELEVEEPPTELLAWLLVDVFPDLVSELEEKCY